MNRLWLAVVLMSLLVPARPAHAERLELWFYYPTNLQVKENVDRLAQVWSRAAALGYAHVLLADSKMARLGDLGDMRRTYYANLARTKKIAADLRMEIVPALFQIGYSNTLLWHDPNLAEGLPVRDSLFVVNHGQARLVADPPVSLAPQPNWKDDTVQLADGVATVRNNRGNARFVYKLNVSPYRCYHVAVKVRTSGYTGSPQINPLAGGQRLQYQAMGVQQTQDWTEHHIVFDSLGNREVALYFGVWGDAHGQLQWKDWRIEEVGLLNVLRREGTPCEVKGYVEGKDYEPLGDPHLGNTPWNGEYQVWHEPPAIRTKTIPDGTRLRVSWYYPPLIYNEQVGICPSEPKTLALLADEAQRMKEAWGTAGYMMSHDEIRVWNQDKACRRRNLDAGQILADNARQCVKLLAGSTAYVWSDMFDPYHNAHKDYYLVRGDLAGSWEGLDQSVVIVNWNFDKRDDSLKFFAGRGHQQVIAAYYDGPLEQVKQWLASAAGVRGVVGIMYTTWANDYSKLEAFAKACGR